MMEEQMKPSGVTWIGDVPQSWSIKRIKYLSQLKGRIGWQGLTSDEYTDEGPYLITGVDFCNGSVDWNSCVHITIERWQEAPEIHIQNGDLLITKDGTVGKVAIVSNLEEKASLNSGVLLVKTKPEYNKKFLYWVLQSEEFWAWFRLKNAGNSTIIHLYQNDFAEFSYTFPNQQEQQSIANFLDEQCAQIDSIAAVLEKQIKVLQQYKDSLISETVTKGLEKSTLMKDSSIDFSQRIRTDWIETKVKYICEMYSGENITSSDIEIDGNYPVYGGNGLRGYYSNYTNSGYHILIGRQGALCGNVHRVSGEFWATDHAIVTYSKRGVEDSFLYYLFTAMNLNKYSQTAAQPGLAVNTIQNLSTCIPPTNELQKQIADYLDEKCDQINSIIETKKSQLTTIQQHKRSLIYEYVTGKKRVKEVLINGN